jgi:hypothetical protein
MKANRAGQVAEEILASLLRSIGIIYDRQVTIGRTIYDTDLRVDFVLLNLDAFPKGLVVESKWQDVGGSVDEKFPYLVENIQQRSPLPTIVVVHGGGCREGAVRWLRNHCDGQRLIAVYGLEEFISWAHRSVKMPLPF